MKKDLLSVPGDYQFKALNNGPISQKLWHKSKLDLVSTILTENKELNIGDIGCGSGIISAKIASISKKYKVWGFDNNIDSILFCQKNYSEYDNAVFNQLNILSEKISVDTNFDYIFSFEVIEHFTELEVSTFLNNLYALGSEKTKYIISSPDYSSFWPFIEYTLDLFKLVPQLQNNQHFSKFSKQSLKFLLEKHNFKVNTIFNFCGLSPFIAHLSVNLADNFHKLEKKHKLGNLICVEFTRADYVK